jgi:DNA-binding MarR family transcriptional regulator
LYPALLKLEQMGWISSRWGESESGRRVRIYALTRAGRRHLHKEEAQWQGALANPALAGAHSHEIAHLGKPVGDAGALVGNLLEDSGASVAGEPPRRRRYIEIRLQTGRS